MDIYGCGAAQGYEAISVSRPLKLVAIGVVKRGIGEGRPFALADLPDAHYSAKRSAVTIANYFKSDPSVEMKFYLNAGSTRDVPPQRISLEQVDRGREHSYDNYHGTESGRTTQSPQPSDSRSGNERFRAATRQDIVGVFRDAVAGKITANGKPASHEVLTGLAGKDEELQRILKDSGK